MFCIVSCLFKKVEIAFIWKIKAIPAKVFGKWGSAVAFGYGGTSWYRGKGGCCKTWKLCNRLFLSFPAQCYKNYKEKSNICFEYWLFLKRNVWEIAPAILFLCLLSYNFIQHNIPCTSQRGIAFPLWKPLLLKQQYPVRVTWRFLSKSGRIRALTRFYGKP